jgi:hypothetical protein
LEKPCSNERREQRSAGPNELELAVALECSEAADAPYSTTGAADELDVHVTRTAAGSSVRAR